METFRIHNVSESAAVPAHRLRYWDRTGLLRPSVKEAAGKGSARLYSERDIVAARAVAKLRDDGASLQKIRKAVLRLKERMPDKNVLADCEFVKVGKGVFAPEIDKWLRAQLSLSFFPA